MDFMFGLLTGIFAMVVALALFVVHVLKVKLDLPAPKTNGHHYPNGSIVSRHNNGDIVGAALKSSESTSRPDFTDVSETRLRNMIQMIIAETVTMAPLAKSYAVSEIALDRPSKLTENMGYTTNGLRHRTEHYFEPTIYQDLLATAVLNKIVDKQSNNNNRNMSESSPDLSHRDEIEDGQADDGSAGLDQNYNIDNQSITSGSSVEPRSECSYTDTEPIITTNDDKSSEYVLDAGRDSALSDYIAAHMVPLPNLSKLATESEEDDYMSVTSSAVGDGNWENNWLFKKKKSTVSSSLGGGSSVGMLVPDPKEDVRAQIGDKTADEISDLSELGSDTDDSSLDLLRSHVDPINDRLFNKHLIGGQNSKLVLDELIERSSMISNTLPTDQEQLYTETRNENVRTEAINSSVGQQTNNNNVEDQKNLEALMPPVDFDDSSSNPLTGSIAEREYKKWYNAVEMPNNPYAPEALKRRISGSQERFIDLPKISPSAEQCPLDMITKDTLIGDESDKRESEIKRYSRDYYINDCAKSSQITLSDQDTSKDATEVNNNNHHNNFSNESFDNHKSRSTRKLNTNDCHWTLSTPVRRSSSLKYLNHRLTSPTPTPPPLPLTRPPTNCYQNRLSLSPRPSTATSYYNHYPYENDEDFNDEVYEYDDDDEENNHYDLRSQHSWKSSSALSAKRRSLSMLSVFSGNTGSSRCSNRSRSQQQPQPDANVLTQFEKQLLHKDLKRNSFRAVSATTKDFVMNPLFEKQQFFNGEGGGLKLSIAKSSADLHHQQQQDDQGGDSGVDSCLNGFSERGDSGKPKSIEDSLMF